MDPQNNVGVTITLDERVRDVDLQRLKFAADVFANGGIGDTPHQALSRLFKAVAKGNDAFEAALLYSWGVR